jgi:hypothetical protein
MQGIAGLTIALVIAAIGFLGLGFGVYELMTHAGTDAGLKTAGAFAVYFIMCLAIIGLAR